MCIIVAKQKGIQLPTKKILQECFKNNSDGAGLMYVKNNKVVIEKGFMTFQDFWHKIKSLKKDFNSDLKDKAIVMHFRIGTHGENDKATTHPFPISGNAEDLRATYFETDIAMAHNGIMYSFNYDDILSDTQSFIKDFVSVFKELNKNFFKNEKVMKIISDKANINSNKLCFLDKNENIYWYGDKVIENGVIYSNSTYKVEKPKYSYSSYHWNYDSKYSYDSKTGWYEPKKSSFKSYKDKKEKTNSVEDFVKKQIQYEILEFGDYYEYDGTINVVNKEDCLLIDNNYNLYEYVNNKLSLIGKDVLVYNKYYNLKSFYWEWNC